MGKKMNGNAPEALQKADFWKLLSSCGEMQEPENKKLALGHRCYKAGWPPCFAGIWTSAWAAGVRSRASTQQQLGVLALNFTLLGWP